MIETIPSEILKTIFSLRSDNGLEATESALSKDLSKAKWALGETPRYRRAGRSPLYISGKYLTGSGRCPATGEKDGDSGPRGNGAVSSSPSKAGSKNAVGKIDETAFYRALHEKGFAVKLSRNLLTDEVEIEVPPSIGDLDLKFGSLPANASRVHVIQTSPQVQVAMSLDMLLKLSGIKP